MQNRNLWIQALVLCLAAIPAIVRATDSDDSWLKNLPVKPGSSPQPEAVQTVNLLVKTGFKMVDGKAWVGGNGTYRLNDGVTGIGYLAGIEATIDDVNDPVFKQCEESLKSDLPKGQKLTIAGPGRFKIFTDKEIPPGYVHGLTVFELTQLRECKIDPIK